MLGPFTNPVAEAASCNVPAFRHHQLAHHPDPEVREALAKNRAASPEILTVLATDRSDDVREVVARNHSTPTAALVTLAGPDQAPDVRAAVASNRTTPPEVLTILAHNHEFSQRVAQNPNTSPSTLTALGVAPDRRTRIHVAGNLATTPEALTSLARDPEVGVPRAVAGNRCTPPEVLVVLAHAGFRMEVAGNPAAPPEILATLADDTDRDVRKRVLWNRSTPQEVLAVLALDGCVRIPTRRTEGPAPVAPTWATVVAPYGRAVEEVAWSLVREGFDGTLEEVVAVAVGALA